MQKLDIQTKLKITYYFYKFIEQHCGIISETSLIGDCVPLTGTAPMFIVRENQIDKMLIKQGYAISRRKLACKAKAEGIKLVRIELQQKDSAAKFRYRKVKQALMSGERAELHLKRGRRTREKNVAKIVS